MSESEVVARARSETGYRQLAWLCPYCHAWKPRGHVEVAIPPVCGADLDPDGETTCSTVMVAAVRDVRETVAELAPGDDGCDAV